MLAPIVTKDMKLFPSRPLPANIKNVRSRAQSLQDMNGNPTIAQKSRVRPIKPRNSQSVGNLPTMSRSPPKGSLVRKPATLDSIAEGVEMSSTTKLVESSKKLTESARNSNSPTSNLKRMPNTEDLQAAIAASDEMDDNSSSSSGSGKISPSAAAGKGLVKWLTGAFRKSTKEEKRLSNNDRKKSS